MSQLRIAHTGDLSAGERAAGRALLYAVFDDMDESDWEHSLGGLHAMVWDGPDLIGHAALIQRRVLHNGRAWRTGYVEGVAVRTDRQGQGHGSLMMDALERVLRVAYDLGALGATDEGAAFYAGRGWRRWQGPTSALTPTGIVRTPDADDAVYVLGGPLDVTGELTCDWRDGDVW
jgi:aminoglycoside 2'-N-acetyltransferase I